MKDAGILSSGRNPANAPALVKQAFDRLLLAVTATERGWPLGTTDGDLSLVPDANPLKVGLNAVAKAQMNSSAVLPDGSAEPAPDREAIRTALLATSALLKDLANQFELDLFGEEPAGRITPARLEPVLPLSPSSAPSNRKAAPAPAATKREPRDQSSAARRRATVPIEPEPPQHSEPGKIEGRSAIELATSSNNITSAAFWSLMDRWHVADLEALHLVGHPGGLTKKGTRPRFKLVGAAAAMFKGLQEIDSALTSLQLEPAIWLSQPIESAPFGDTTPIAYLTQEKSAGIRSTIRFILQAGLKLSMSASTKSPRSGQKPI